MIGRFFGFALARVGDALDVMFPMDAATVEAVRSAEALSDKEAEEDAAEPEWEPDCTPSTIYRCADCAWESFNYPALRAHREREHPTVPQVHTRRGMGAEDYCTCDGPWPCNRIDTSSVADAAATFPQYTKTSAAVDPPNPAAESSEEVVSPAPLATTSSGHLDGGPSRRTGEASARPVQLGRGLLGPPQTESATDSATNLLCGVGHSWAPSAICTKPLGHTDPHGNLGIFWPNPNLAGAVSAGCSTGQPTLADWLEPAIQEVLTEHRHRGVYRYCTVCRCGAPGMGYYEDWQDHVACVLAEHLAKALEAKENR